MRILGVETTCDETGVAIVEDGRRILANVVASSVELHKKYGGIVPEVAAREQVRVIIPVVNEALTKAFGLIRSNNSYKFAYPIDAIAVANGPGLVGSLLIGVETAKTLALAWNKPLVPVNHLIGHVYANWLHCEGYRKYRGYQGYRGLNFPKACDTPDTPDTPKFPLIALIVSGGHTDLILMTDHATPANALRKHGGRGKYRWLGGTLDDAAGEAFDKVARVLGLPYPGGPEVERLAQQLTTDKKQLTIKFPRPLVNQDNFDFSFSGLKTAVVNLIKNSSFYSSSEPFDRTQGKLRESRSSRQARTITKNQISLIAYEFQQAIVGVLVKKTIKAAQKFNAKEILLGGGVAANKLLRLQLTVHGSQLGIPVRFPSVEFCIDNGAMIAAAAYFNFKPKPIEKIQAEPGLYF